MSKPTNAIRNAARRAKRELEKYKDLKNKPMTRIGITRMNQLISGENLSLNTIKRMSSFLARHRQNYKPNKRDSQGRLSKGTIAFLAWGGLAAIAWSKTQIKKLESK